MDFTSFLTSLGTSFVIFVVLMIVFAWLSSRPGNLVVYYPNRILKGLEPMEGGKKTRNPFSWIKEAASSSERDIIAMSGVDTAVYFVFLSTGLFVIFLLCSSSGGSCIILFLCFLLGFKSIFAIFSSL